MPPDDDDRDYERPPAWIAAIMAELDRLHKIGSTATRETYETALTFLSGLEIESMPMPRVEVLSRNLLRVTWANGWKTLAVDARPGAITIRTSDPGRADKHARGCKLLDTARQTFRWFNPRVPTAITEDE